MAELNINYNVTGLDRLIEGLEALNAKFSSLEEKLVSTVNDSGLNRGTSSSNLDGNTQPGQTSNFTNNLASVINRSINSQTSLISKIEALTNILKENNQSSRRSPSSNPNPEEASKNAGKFSRTTRNLLLAYGAAGIYEAGSFGTTAGSAAGSLNTSFQNYSQFETEQYNKQASNIQSAGSTGLTIGGTLAANSLFSSGGITGKVLGGAVLAATGVANYFLGSKTEKDKQQNERANVEDINSFRLLNSGISSLSSSALKVPGSAPVKITDLQRDSLNGQYSKYNATLSDTIFGAKRDEITGLSRQQQIEYNAHLNMLGVLSGNSNIKQLSNQASVLASVTGATPNGAAKSMLDNFVKYGGDTASNTAKLVQLLETSPLSVTKANDLVNRYQYNPAMLQNQVALATASPSSNWKASLLLQLAGTPASDIAQGKASPKQLEAYRKLQANPRGSLDINAMLLEGAYSARGQNINARDVGFVNSSGAQAGSMQPTDLMNSFSSQISDSLKNLTVGTQTVTATGNVYINGTVSNAVSSVAKRYMSSLTPGLPSTGTGQDANLSSNQAKEQRDAITNIQNSMSSGAYIHKDGR